MIMLTVTKPRRKLKRLLKGGALLLLLGVVVPGIYHSLEAMGAMSLFASGETVVQSEQAEQNGQGEQIEQKQQTMQIEQTAPVKQPEQTAPAESTEQIEQSEQNEQKTGALDAVTQEEPGTQEEPAAPEEEAEKPGLWQRLKAVIFGEKAEVVPY